jgi:hypothetical protein
MTVVGLTANEPEQAAAAENNEDISGSVGGDAPWRIMRNRTASPVHAWKGSIPPGLEDHKTQSLPSCCDVCRKP